MSKSSGLTGLVDFLAAPLKTLAGDPSSMTSSSQDMHNSGQALSQHADSYQRAAGTETSGWSGAGEVVGQAHPPVST